jgi:hypothetical protein
MANIDGVIEMACLGRPLRLGMLYDCRNDTIIPALTLWNEGNLKSAIDTTPQVGSDFEVIAEDSLETRASQLNVSGSLKLSFMGGLIDVSGSAKYLNDYKTSKQQSRVSLKYWSTSRFEQLTMEQLGNIKYPEVFSNKIATHVVVSVLYGADAIFVFNRMVSENEEQKDVHGEVEALVKRLPGMSDFKGEVELGMSEKNREAVNKIECKFHGDLKLPKTPTTFQDAVQVFQQLPELLNGKEGPIVVPKKVWLYPLSKLNSYAAKIVHDISVSLVSQAEKVMEELIGYEMQCNDLTKSKECSYFSGLQSQLSKFKGLILQYKMDICKQLAGLLPAIREGGSKESQLANIFKSKEASPFSTHKLTRWLQRKESEVKILVKYFQALQEISCVEFALSAGDLDAITTDLKCDFVVCFCFQMLKSDANLKQMQAFLDKRLLSSQLKETKSWTIDEVLMTKMRKQVVQFTSFARANEKRNKVKFVVADISEQCLDSGTDIVLFEKGVKRMFDPPVHPESLQPSAYGITHCSITLEWSKPMHGSVSVQRYAVQYGRKLEDGSIDQWVTKQTDANETSLAVDSLQPATPYCFRVWAECEAGISEYNEMSNLVFTSQSDRLAEIVKATSSSIETGPPPVYKVRSKEIDFPGKMLHKVSVGKANQVAEEKVLMVLGATGAGKSTLINGMINYIFGVKWSDSFRFKLITEEGKSQAHSQTSSITAYTIYHRNGSCVKYNLTIIDTPGFGDTAGLKRDKEITEQIKEFFSVQDGQKPPVMSAIQAADIPYSAFFKFNNSALFAENSEDDEDNFDEMFWRMGVSSFKKFFAAFQKAESVSLTMTKDVLKNRDRLQVIIIGLQQQMRFCLSEMEVLRQERIVLKEHEKDIATNKDFVYKIKVPCYITEKIPDNEYITNCLLCSRTCHYPCRIPDNDQKSGCWAMDSSGNCTQCVKRCHWMQHKNTREKFTLSYKIETGTSDDLKNKFETALEGKAAVEGMLASHRRKLEEAHAELHEMIEEARLCLMRLGEIALKPNPLTQVEYLELLIESEKQQAKEGWKNRVKYLETTKEQAKLLAIMKDTHDIDKRIAEEEEEKKPGWEENVETLQQVKRIKCEVEFIKMERENEGKGPWGTLKEAAGQIKDAASSAIKATGKAISNLVYGNQSN